MGVEDDSTPPTLISYDFIAEIVSGFTAGGDFILHNFEEIRKFAR